MRKRIGAVLSLLIFTAIFLSLLSSSPKPLPEKLSSQFSDELTALHMRWLNLVQTVERIEKLDAVLTGGRKF
jgi:hypothetical protein